MRPDSQSFYSVTLPQSASYFLGTAELVLSLALLFGVFRTASYGLALVMHTVTVLVSWRQLFDPTVLPRSAIICGSLPGRRSEVSLHSS